jgi:hypothetical protein
LTLSNGATFASYLGTITATENASMTASADYGTLSVDATGSKTGSFSEAAFGNLSAAPAGQPPVQFLDTLTITPTVENPAGTLVAVTFTEAFTRSTFSITGSSPYTAAQLIGTLLINGNGTSLGAIFGQSYKASGAESGYSVPLPYPTSGLAQGNATSYSNTVSLQVGAVYTIVGGIYAVGEASAAYDTTEGLGPATNSVTERATSQLYINTYGLAYTTASGTTYPVSQLPPPTLYIQSTNGQGVVVYWSAAYTNCVLQQNPSLTPADWEQNTNHVSTANGTNYVTINPASGMRFFRLTSP